MPCGQMCSCLDVFLIAILEGCYCHLISKARDAPHSMMYKTDSTAKDI